MLREQDKHFLWSIFGATGIILFWKGIWEGIGGLPYIEEPWVSLFIGLSMLTFSGLIFKEFDPLGSLEKSTLKILHQIHNHPQKHQFHLKYHDKLKNKDILIKGNQIRHIEKNHIIIEHQNGQEFFLPIPRIKEILHQNKTYWKY